MACSPPWKSWPFVTPLQRFGAKVASVKSLVRICLAASVFASCLPAHSETLRCNGHIVETGDSRCRSATSAVSRCCRIRTARRSTMRPGSSGCPSPLPAPSFPAWWSMSGCTTGAPAISPRRCASVRAWCSPSPTARGQRRNPKTKLAEVESPVPRTCIPLGIARAVF